MPAGTTSTRPSNESWRRIVDLIPKVVCDDPTRTVAHHVRLGRGDLGDEVDTVGAGLDRRRCANSTCEASPKAPGIAPTSRIRRVKPSRVDTGDARDRALLEQRIEMSFGAVVAVAPGQVANDHRRDRTLGAIIVSGRDAVVADVRIGEGDDLPA